MTCKATFLHKFKCRCLWTFFLVMNLLTFFFLQQGQFSNPETPGYVGFANLPNQVHRKSVKKGFEFTLMVVGECVFQAFTCFVALFFRFYLVWKMIVYHSDNKLDSKSKHEHFVECVSVFFLAHVSLFFHVKFIVGLWPLVCMTYSYMLSI